MIYRNPQQPIQSKFCKWIWFESPCQFKNNIINIININDKVPRKSNRHPLCWLSQNLISHAISSALKKWNVTSALKGVPSWPFISYWGGCLYSPSTAHIATTVSTFICNRLSVAWDTKGHLEDCSLKYLLKCRVHGVVRVTINLDLRVYLKVRQCWFETYLGNFTGEIWNYLGSFTGEIRNWPRA